MASKAKKINVLRVLPRTQASDGQTEWVPDRAICALRLHTRLVSLLVEKLDLPNLQELRFRRERTAPPASDEAWQASAGGGLYRHVALESPLWQRLWSGLEDGANPSTFCLSNREIQLIHEVDLHVTCALMHLGHASSHIHEVGRLLSTDLAKRTQTPTSEVDEAEATGEQVDHEVSENAHRFHECLDNLVEVLWSFHLRLQLVHAVFLGDVFRLVHWSLRLLGLSTPWPLRKLHDFALTCLELLLEQGEDARETAESWLTDSSALYLGVPVIPRMQSRMRTCLHSLRRGNWFQSKLLDELLNLETDGSDFDATGSNLGAFRTEDPIHCRFQRLIREAVVGRVDRSCHMDCRQHGLKAQCCSPINSSAWTKSRRCELLLEVLDSVPQEPRQRVLQLLDEETPEERAMQSDIQRQISTRNTEFMNFAFCSGVCPGKPID